MLSDPDFSLIHIILITRTLNPTLIISEILQYIDSWFPYLVLQRIIHSDFMVRKFYMYFPGL